LPEHCQTASPDGASQLANATMLLPLMIGRATGELFLACLAISPTSILASPHGSSNASTAPILRRIFAARIEDVLGHPSTSAHTGALIAQPAPGLLMLVSGALVRTLRSHDANPDDPAVGWGVVEATDGLYTKADSINLREASFNHVVGCPGAPNSTAAHFFVGGFTGVFAGALGASDVSRRGDSQERGMLRFVKLDTMFPFISSLSVAPAFGATASDGRLAVAACTCSYTCGLEPTLSVRRLARDRCSAAEARDC
jgi:hypothetical protein